MGREQVHMGPWDSNDHTELPLFSEVMILGKAGMEGVQARLQGRGRGF